MRVRYQFERNLKSFLTLIIFVSISGLCFGQPVQIETPDGYAGYMGTTGGGNAAPITVTTSEELTAAVEGDDPAVIIIDGIIPMDKFRVGSNKTIVGADSSSGISGGVIQVRGTNYIFQNLTLGPSDEDVLEVSGATNVFIHKCDFYDSSDELLSVVREADFVTISWCKFYFNNSDSHSFGHLIGNSDSRETDRGKLNVTMHHNWYDDGIIGRMPRVRFGHVHIFNNYYNSSNTNYCIGTGKECHIRVEKCHFDQVDNLWKEHGALESGGIIGWDDLKVEGGSTPNYINNSYPGFSLPYTYTPDPVDKVKEMLISGAGNVFPVTSSDFESAHNDVFSVSPNPTKDLLFIDMQIDQSEIARISLINIIGKTVMDYDLKSNQNHQVNPLTLDLETLECGTFVLIVENEKGEKYSSKIIKM